MGQGPWRVAGEVELDEQAFFAAVPELDPGGSSPAAETGTGPLPPMVWVCPQGQLGCPICRSAGWRSCDRAGRASFSWVLM